MVIKLNTATRKIPNIYLVHMFIVLFTTNITYYIGSNIMKRKFCSSDEFAQNGN